MLRHPNFHLKNPCRRTEAWQLLPSGVVGKPASYTVTGNLMRKVLDFIQLGGEDCPSRPFPQQTGVPSALSAHVLCSPALIEINLSFGDGEVCPLEFLPQHTGTPFFCKAQVCSPPLLIDTSADADGGEVAPADVLANAGYFRPTPSMRRCHLPSRRRCVLLRRLLLLTRYLLEGKPVHLHLLPST